MPAFVIIMQEYDVEDSVLPLQPSLNYTAPELVRSKTASAGLASDIFSFGCLAYHLIARKPLFDCHNNVKMVLFYQTFGLSFYLYNPIVRLYRGTGGQTYFYGISLDI